MGVIRDENPCITSRLSLRQEFCQTVEHVLSILSIYEYLSTLYTSDHNVVHYTGRVHASRPA